jgi:HAD superfamily hydrolase (TIGR01549 family)
MYKNVIFDFDGTIADTLPRTYKVANELARESGRPSLAPIEDLRNMNARQFIKSLNIPMFKIMKYAKRIQKDLKENMHTIKPFPRMHESIEALKSKGIRVGIVSSNTKENINAFLEHHNLKMDFVHAKPSIFGKHKKIRHAMRLYGMNAHDTLYIGDEVRDIDACRKLNLDVGTVTWGFNTKNVLEAGNPNYLFTSPAQILSIVRP